jgi:hypothetical protein
MRIRFPVFFNCSSSSTLRRITTEFHNDELKQAMARKTPGQWVRVSTELAAYKNVEIERAKSDLEEHQLVCVFAPGPQGGLARAG